MLGDLLEWGLGFVRSMKSEEFTEKDAMLGDRRDLRGVGRFSVDEDGGVV